MGLVPDDATAAPDGHSAVTTVPARPLGQAGPWRDRRFVTLATGAALGLFAQIGLVAQLFSLLVRRRVKPGAGITMGLATACAIAGRTALGSLLRPTTSRRAVAAMNVAMQACGSLVLLAAAGHSVPLLLIGCMLFGLGLGNVTSLPPLIAQAEFTLHGRTYASPT